MPTVVRYVCKVVLFILVIAVSGVGVAQAQTDPDVVPTNTEAVTDGPAAGVITPDVVRQSGRIYATAEQAMAATVTGGAEYMGSKTIAVSSSWFDSFTKWNFYAINGREDHFFVDMFYVATGKGEYRIRGLSTRFGAYPGGEPSNARLKQWAPGSSIDLPDDRPTTFSIDYQGASIARTFHASPNTHLIVRAPEDYFGTGILSHNVAMSYVGDYEDPDYPKVFTIGSVSRWEGDPPWGRTVLVRGTVYPPSPRQPGQTSHTWDVVERVEKPR